VCYTLVIFSDERCELLFYCPPVTPRDPCCPLLRARIAHGTRTPGGSTRGQQLGHGSVKMACVPMRRHTMCASPSRTG